MNDWFSKDRSETDQFRMPKRLLGGDIYVENPALGINVYKNVLGLDFQNKIISTLEEELSKNNNYSWQNATVTESDDPLSEARYCVDFKIGQGNLGERNKENAKLYDMHQECFNKIYPVAIDYGNYWGVGLEYFEVFNFVKYEGAGTHFNIHADHGPAYVSTVSIVAYVNDDYEGGELYFPRFDLNIKPDAGDVLIFPSTYIYEHASKPMISGTKYSIVIMTDYNDRGGLRYYAYRNHENKLTY